MPETNIILTQVMFAPFDHEEEGAQDFVADGDDGAFLASAHNERLEFRFEHGCGTVGGMGKLTQQATDIEIALADSTGLALAGRLVVAGADAYPRGEVVGSAEGSHIGAVMHKSSWWRINANRSPVGSTGKSPSG